MDNNELYHYGVLGMRWGVRKQEKNAVLSNRRAHKTNIKSYSKAVKQHRKGVTSDETFNRIEGLNSRTRNRVSKQSSLKTAAQVGLFGNKGALEYNTRRANGETRGKATAKVLAKNTVKNGARLVAAAAATGAMALGYAYAVNTYPRMDAVHKQITKALGKNSLGTYALTKIAGH